MYEGLYKYIWFDFIWCEMSTPHQLPSPLSAGEMGSGWSYLLQSWLMRPIWILTEQSWHLWRHFSHVDFHIIFNLMFFFKDSSLNGRVDYSYLGVKCWLSITSPKVKKVIWNWLPSAFAEAINKFQIFILSINHLKLYYLTLSASHASKINVSPSGH
jgi:hypothetical protein